MNLVLLKLKSLWQAFQAWVEEPVDPRPLGLFRCWFGFLCLVNLLLLWPDMPMWFGNNGVFPPEVHSVLNKEFRLQIYAFTGYSDFTITLMRLMGLAGGIGLTLGLFTRTSAFFIWLVASSYAWRNSGVHNSGDNLIRIGCFFLMFACSDQAFSLKAYLARRNLWPFKTQVAGSIPAWPQRILQIQLCIVYLVAAILKLKGDMWRDGTAVGMVLQLGEFERFPIPDFVMTSAGSAFATYFTVGFELLFPFLIWFDPLRRFLMILGLLLHGGLEWTMNIQMFQWIITSYYILFIRFDKKPVKSDA
ncbi:MAG: HTTM domain-containing protein [bacterium]